MSLRAETTYSFLSRSSLPEFERVQSMLERWVKRLPKTHQEKTVANMRHKAPGSARNQAQFNAAFFELFLHEFLRGTGGEVQVETTIDGLTPDFRVTEELAGSRQLAYVVEAALHTKCLTQALLCATASPAHKRAQGVVGISIPQTSGTGPLRWRRPGLGGRPGTSAVPGGPGRCL